MKSTRRSFVALTGASVLGAASLRSLSVAAQSAIPSPYTFADGTTLTWSEPWWSDDDSTVAPFADMLTLWSAEADQTTLIVGYFATPTGIDEWIPVHLDLLGLSEDVVAQVAGGGSASVGPGGVVASQMDYRTYLYKAEDESLWGIYFQTVDQINATVVYAPVDKIAAMVGAIQSNIARDGVPVLDGIDGASIQSSLEGSANRLAGETEPIAVSSEVEVGGEYSDSTGNLHVTWPAGWAVVSYNEVGTELANPEQSVVLNLQVVPFEGRSWEQVAQDDSAWLAGDQGPNATLTGPMVTDTGYSFATEGDYGLRLVQGLATANDPENYIRVFAANMEANGAAAQAILTEVQSAVTVNGQAPLQGLDAFIDMSAS